MNVIPLILIIASLALCFCATLGYAHIFQLEGYKAPGYFKWLGEKGLKRFWLVLLSAVCLTFGWAITISWLQYAVLALGTVLLVPFMLSLRIKNAKKPLVYTARVKRLLTTEIVVMLALFAVCFFVFYNIIGVIILLTPLYVVIANAINKPIESAISNHYLNDAKRKIDARGELIKIGITGSYGKTSTKFILGAILSQKYHVLVPPSSYNTPMGLTRVIREQLRDEHEVFLAEMGAKHVGDIAELVELVHPKYGIITSVGPQHLETFGSIENVAATKYELIEGLPADGVAFFPNDGAITKALYDKTSIKKRLFSIDREADITAKDISVSPAGSTFTLVKPDGSEVVCTSRLLGRHNIENILGGIAVALELGLTDEQIAAGVAAIEPVEHRLQIIPTANGVTVIDDAFNSNPSGARAALDVIAGFGGRKLVVTPGMVELGAVEAEENKKFGAYMAGIADVVFLVGAKHTRPIYEGLAEAGFDMNSVFVCASLDEASARMAGMLRAGDVLIFENDLPDNYNE